MLYSLSKYGIQGRKRCNFMSKYETHIEPNFDLIKKMIEDGATEKHCAETLRRCIFNIS